MGMMDRDWYQEHWRRNVLGIEDSKGDATGAPAVSARRAERLARRVPAGAGAGRFWLRLYQVAAFFATLVLGWHWLRG